MRLYFFSPTSTFLIFIFLSAVAPAVSMNMNMGKNKGNNDNMKKGCATHGGYRLQATSYTLTPETTLALKEENCRTNFGKDAFVFDFSKAPTDFAHEEEFNQALAAVFFKQPAALFYVTYEGTDEPTTSSSNNNNNKKKFVIQTTAPSTNEYQYGDFGRAHLSASIYQAQLLCAVPVKEYKPSGNKSYKSPEESSGIASSSTTKGIMMVVLVLGLLGTGLLVLRRASIQGGTFPVMFSKAYYTILPQSMKNNASTATNYDDNRHNDYQGDDVMMAHCELSSSTNTSVLIGPNDGI